jgi:pimeloyl-ACP methyl ester carboxylesterase
VGDTRITQLDDGRELAWLEVGKARGAPVFAFHGTPGSRRQVSFDEATITASGVRLVAPDRPGYGHSSYHAGRTLRDWASDVAALADHLKIERFAVIGVSGGGPHAAACARFLPDRVSIAGLVSGVGPIAEPELHDSMEGFNRGLMRLAQTVAPALLPLFALQQVVGRHWPDKVLQTAQKRMAEPDAALLDRPDVRAVFLEDARQATGSSARAAAQDFELFVRDWGFRLADIAVPVHVWHGDLDKNVPFSHGEYMAARIPGARFHACPGEGHLLVVDHLGEILRAVSVTP